jgi:hypothetical protein
MTATPVHATPPPPRPRTRDNLTRALVEDASAPIYRWIWRPMLALQFVNYLRVVVNLSREPRYAQVGGAADPALHANHIGNLIVLKAQPNIWLLSVHMAMALLWIGATMWQKHFVAKMAGALATPGRGPAFARYRRVHARMGWSLSVLGIVGILIGPVLALLNHGNQPMRRFLLTQPLFFLPLMAMVLISARNRRWSIRTHKFWAETAYLGPALASLWAEAMIYAFGQLPQIGPRKGDLLASQIAAVLSVFLVVLPAWIARRRGLAADARAHSAAATSSVR